MKLFSGDKQHKQLERLIRQGELPQALETINQALQDTDSLTQQEQLKLKSLKARILVIKCDYLHAMNLSKEIFTQSQNLQDNSLAFIALSLIIQMLRIQGDFSQCEEYLRQGSTMLQRMAIAEKAIFHESTAVFKYLRGLVYHEQNAFTKALSMFQESYNFYREENDQNMITKLLLSIGKVYLRSGDFEAALTKFTECLVLYEELGKLEEKDDLLQNLGIVYTNIGKGFNKAIEYFQQSIEVSKQLGNTKNLASTYNNVALFKLRLWEFDQALNYYLKALKLSKKLSYRRLEAVALENIGFVYHLQGRVTKALQYTQKALTINRTSHFVKGEAECFKQLGLIYYDMDKETKAEKHLLQSVQLFKRLGNKLFIAVGIFNLFLFYSNLGDRKKAQQYKNEIQAIYDQFQHPAVRLGLQVSEAVFLKLSPRMSDQMNALKRFKDLTKKRLFGMFPQIVNLYLCELLFNEYQTTQSKEILQDIHKTISRLEIIADKQNSFILKAKSLFFKAKAEIYENHPIEAQKCLIEAQNIADAKNLRKMAHRISEEHDYMLQRLNKLHKSLEYNDQVELASQLFSPTTMKDLVSHKALLPLQESYDIPITFLIIAESGLTLFSHHFTDDIKLDKQLMGGFLTAINQFGKELFSVKNTIDRILYKKYIVALKSYQSMIFCYIFKGYSYFALKKLDQVLSELKQHTTYMTELLERGQTGIILSDENKQALKRIITKKIAVSSRVGC